MNDTHQELRDLITDLVTGEGAQLENVDFDEAYWREMAEKQTGGEDIEITVSVELWMRMIGVAKNNMGVE